MEPARVSFDITSVSCSEECTAYDLCTMVLYFYRDPPSGLRMVRSKNRGSLISIERENRGQVRLETGKEYVVQVHYDEGIANHIGPKPCVDRPRGRARSVGRGKYRPAIEPRKLRSECRKEMGSITVLIR